MNFQDRGNVITLVVAILGLVKIIADLFGYNLGLTDEDINKAADYVATIFVITGIVLNNHHKSTSFRKER